MSNIEKHSIPCPKCKTISEQNIFHSINTSINNIIDKILNDEINFVTCPDCGNRFQVKTGLLFNNMEKQYALYFHPTTFEFIDQECLKSKRMFGNAFYLTNPTKFHDWQDFKSEVKRREGIVDFDEPVFEDDNEEDKLIIPGRGVGGIVINQHSSKDVINKYGNDYEMEAIFSYSYEMRYDEGISFFFKQDDPREIIYFIRVRPEFNAYTEDGLDLNNDFSLRDVAEIYGFLNNLSVSESTSQAYARYDGISFYVDYQEALSLPGELLIVKEIGIH